MNSPNDQPSTPPQKAEETKLGGDASIGTQSRLPSWLWPACAIAVLSLGVIGSLGSLVDIIPRYLKAREVAHPHPHNNKETPKVDQKLAAPAAVDVEPTTWSSIVKTLDDWWHALQSAQPWILLMSALLTGLGLLWGLALLIDRGLDKHGILAHGLHEAGMALVVSCLIGGSIEMTIQVYHHIELTQQVKIRETLRTLLDQLGKKKGTREPDDYKKIVETIGELRKNLQKHSRQGEFHRLDELEVTFLNEWGEFYSKKRDLKNALVQFEAAKGRDGKDQKTLYNLVLAHHNVWSQELEDPKAARKKADDAMKELLKNSEKGYWENYYENIQKGIKNHPLLFNDEGGAGIDVDLKGTSEKRDLRLYLGKRKETDETNRKAMSFLVKLEKGKSYMFRLERIGIPIQGKPLEDPFLILYRDRAMEKDDDENLAAGILDSRIYLHCDFDGEWIVCASTLYGPQNARFRLRIYQDRFIKAADFSPSSVKGFFTQILGPSKIRREASGEFEIEPEAFLEDKKTEKKEDVNAAELKKNGSAGKVVVDAKGKLIAITYTFEKYSQTYLDNWNKLKHETSEAILGKAGTELSGSIFFEEGLTLSQLDEFHATMRIERKQFLKFIDIHMFLDEQKAGKAK